MQKVDTTFFASTHRTKVLRSSTSLAEDGTLTPYRGSVFAPEIAAPTLQEVNPIRINFTGAINAVIYLLGPAGYGRLFLDHAVHQTRRTERRSFLLHGACGFEHHCSYLCHCCRRLPRRA